MNKDDKQEKNSISMEDMFSSNLENIKDISEIMEMHNLCIKKLTEKQKVIETKIDKLFKIVNKLAEKL